MKDKNKTIYVLFGPPAIGKSYLASYIRGSYHGKAIIDCGDFVEKFSTDLYERVKMVLLMDPSKTDCDLLFTTHFPLRHREQIGLREMGYQIIELEMSKVYILEEEPNER